MTISQKRGALPEARTHHARTTRYRRRLRLWALGLCAATGVAAAQPDLSALRNSLDGVEPGGWVKVSRDSDRFDAVWTPSSLRPDGFQEPSQLIRNFASFAWDSRRGNLLLFGGGLSYFGNEVYLWSGTTQSWQRASLPSEPDPNNVCLVRNGVNDAPPSIAVYDGLVYLPRADRMLALGGTLASGPSFYCRTFDNDRFSNSQLAGPYMFDPSRADADRVGGSTGSQIDPSIEGGNMWQNRDTFATPTADSPKLLLNLLSAYTEENGRDVVYFTASDGFGQDFDLFRYTVGEAGTPGSDSVDKVGVNFGNVQAFNEGYGAAGYDPDRQIFVRTNNVEEPIVFYDLSGGGGENNRSISVRSFNGDDAAFKTALGENQGFGIDYDRENQRFVLWGGGGVVWELIPPQVLSELGWSVQQITAPSGTATPVADVGDVWGRWKYIPELGAFMALYNDTRGEVWLYKTGAGGGPPAETPLFSDHFEDLRG